MILMEMVVTDADGKTETAEGTKLTGKYIRGEDVYTFFAIKQINPPKSKPTAEQKPAKVRLTMPTGGDQNGLYRFPRVGEKVLIGVEGISHYLMSYLPTAESPFSPKENGKEKTDAFDKEGQVLRYKKTGENTSDSTYSEIGFYSESTEWSEKEGSTNKKLEDKTNLPIVDKIKVSSTGDIESYAQNYNETAAKRIGLFAGYGDDIKKRKAKRKKNLADNKTDLDMDAFPALPQDYADQDPAFLAGDIQMRAKRRMVLKAEKGIDLMVGSTVIRLEQSGISMFSRKESVSAVNSWDSAISISAREGIKMNGTSVKIGSVFGFGLSDGWGASISSLGGVLRMTGCNIRAQTLSKVSYAFKGGFASANFALNMGSMSDGIAQQEKGASGTASGIPSKISTIAIPIIDGFIGFNWGLSVGVDIADPAGTLKGAMEFIMILHSAVHMALEMAMLSEEQYNSHGREAINMASMVVEYGLVMGMFIGICASTPDWLHMASLMLDNNGHIWRNSFGETVSDVHKEEVESPTAGLDTTYTGKFRDAVGGTGKAIVLGTLGLATVLGGIGGGVAARYFIGVKPANNALRKELEAL